MKDAFNKLLEKELDNLVYVGVAITLIVMAGWLNIPAEIKPMVQTLLGVVLVKIKGA